MPATDLAGVAHVLVLLEVAHHPAHGMAEEDGADASDPGTIALGFPEPERSLGDELGRYRAVGVHRHHRIVVSETGKEKVEDLIEGPGLLVEVSDGRLTVAS